jgi:hypothetical protein
MLLNIKERFETTRQHSILHPERIVGTPEVIPRNVGKSEHCRKAILSKHLSWRELRRSSQRQAFKDLSILIVAGYGEIAEMEEVFGCGGWICSPVAH